MCWYVLSPAGYLLYIFSSRCESVPSEKNIVNVQIWKPNMFLLLYIYFFPMRILNPNTKIKKEEPEAWMNICQLLFSYLMKIQWYKISLYRRKYKLTKKNVSSPCVYSELVNNRCLINIATGETSQVITSRHFSSLLFTFLYILTSLALFNRKANTIHMCFP